MNHLIVGASRGLGDAFARGVPKPGDAVWLVSRSEPASLRLEDGVSRSWIQADLSEVSAPGTIAVQLGKTVLDTLIHNAGIWEGHAFSAKYRLENVPDDQTREILSVNLAAAITVTRALLPNLRGSNNPKIVLIGSINGLENAGMPEVAYTASKFGLRGVAHGLREHLRPDRIGVTVINPGSFAADERPDRDDLIPPSDLVRIVQCVLETSRRTVIKEIDVPAMSDEMV